MKNFILVDCNNFFVSCERLFNPKLIGKPVVVLSNNDGCVVSRSNEAKKLGIPMGAAAFEYEYLFKKNNVFVFSSNFTLYADISSRVMQTLSELSTDIEVYSVDEAFLFVPEVTGNITDYARYIRAEVLKRTGIPVSLGIGPTKTLAKVANKFAKKQLEYGGVFNINDKNIDDLLSKFDVADIWGVGYQYSKLLVNSGIKTAKDLKYGKDEWIRKKMTVMGLRTVLELRGQVCYDLQTNPDTKKSITVSRSFGSYVTTLDILKQAVASYASRAAEKLRKENLLVSVVTVFVSTNRYHDNFRYFNSRSIELNIASSYTPDILNAAHKALESIFKFGYQYKKAGIIFSNLIPQGHVQLTIGSEIPDFSKNNKLMKTFDKINTRWGRNRLSFASIGTNHDLFKSKREKKSQNYTTSWHELLTIEI